MHSVYADISPSVRFHGQRLVDVLDGDEVREYTPGAPRTRVMSVTRLKLSSSVADADRLRRLWDFSLFCSLRTLDVTGNLISEIEPSALSGLTCLEELRIARNRLRSLKGMEVLAGTLRKLDASGNHLLTLCDGAVGKLELLEELNVAGNELKGLKNIAALKGLLQLSTLDMRVNPLTEGDHHHQEFAVYHIKSLENMDGVPITAELRVAAHQRFGDMSQEKLEEEVKKAGAGLKSSLDRAKQEAEALRLENERLKDELRVRCLLLDTATHTATEARQELVELQHRLAFLSIDSGDNDDPETTDDRLQRLIASSCAPLSLLPPPPLPPSLLSPPQASPPTPLPGSRKRTAARSGDRMEDQDTVGSAGCEHTGSRTRESMLQEDEPQEPLTPFDLLASPIDGEGMDLRGGGGFARHKPSARHTLQPPMEVKLGIMESDEGGHGPQSSETSGSPTLAACWMSPARPQDAHGPTSRGAGEHVSTTSGCGRGGAGDGGDMGGSTGGAGQSVAVDASAAEVAEATQELSAQREVLRSQIEAKRSTLARVRQCLSVLSHQLAEARREAGDAEMGLLEGAEPDRRGRASLLIEKRRHLQRLKKHMAGLESRLGGLKNTLSAKTVEFVTQNKQQPQGAGRAESPPYDPSMIELGKEVEVTSDEIASVASRLSRLTSEVEVLESHLSGSLPTSYFRRRDEELHSPVRAADAPQAPSCDTSPSSPLGKGAWGLSLPQLEENGAVLRRFAGESATEFVLRLRQRVRAAKVLMERLDGEIEAMQCELEQAGQILAQLERQALHHELAEARRDAKVSKHQAQALMQALHRRTAAGKDAQDVRLTLQEILTNPEVAEAWPNRRPARQPSPPKASSRGGHEVDEDRYESSGASLLNSYGPFRFSSSGGEERSGGEKASVGKHGVQQALDRAAHVQRASVPHRPTPSTRNTRRRSSVSLRGARNDSTTYESVTSTFDGESLVDQSCFTEEGPTHRTAADMSLGPREIFEKLRAVEHQLNEAIDVEEVDKATGMVVDRRTGMSVGRVDVCVLGIEGLVNYTARGKRRDAGALSVLITMDPVTSCLGRTGAFGFGSYLFRASQPFGEQRFVIKPVLTKHASLRFVFTEGASSRSTAASERPIGEASVPLSCLDDQRPHILCLPLSQPEQIGSKRKAPGSGSGTQAQHLDRTETSLAVRVRARFTYSRVDVLQRRLNQLMLVVETRGYDLDQIEQDLSEADVDETDAPRRKGGAETTHEQSSSANEADMPSPPPPPMSPQSMPRQRHMHAYVHRMASQKSVPRRVHAQQQPQHAEREPFESPQRSPPVVISGSLRRKIASRPRRNDIRHPADAGDGASVQGEGASVAADLERNVDGRMSFSRAHLRTSPGTPNVDVPQLGRRDNDGQTHMEGGRHGRKVSAVAKQRSTPSRDEFVEYSEEVDEGRYHRSRPDVDVSRDNKENRPRVHKLNHADTSGDSIFGAIVQASQADGPSQSHDDDSMVMHGTATWRSTHKRPRNCSPAKTVRQSKPVMEQLYDSLSRFQGVRRELMQHTGDATGGATDSSVSGGGGAAHAVGGQSIPRPAASECFDHGSPYHPDKRSPYLPSAALEQYAFPHPDQEVDIIPHTPTTGKCTPPVLVATETQLDDRNNDHHDNTPSSPAARHAPPPSTVAAAAGAMYDTHERLEVDDSSGPPSRHEPDLSIFRSPAMRRMEAMRNEGVVTRGRGRGPGLVLQQKSVISGRYIGAGVHEMKWREEMVGRLMEYP